MSEPFPFFQFSVVDQDRRGLHARYEPNFHKVIPEKVKYEGPRPPEINFLEGFRVYGITVFDLRVKAGESRATDTLPTAQWIIRALQDAVLVAEKTYESRMPSVPFRLLFPRVETVDHDGRLGEGTAIPLHVLPFLARTRPLEEQSGLFCELGRLVGRLNRFGWEHPDLCQYYVVADQLRATLSQVNTSCLDTAIQMGKRLRATEETLSKLRSEGRARERRLRRLEKRLLFVEKSFKRKFRRIAKGVPVFERQNLP